MSHSGILVNCLHTNIGELWFKGRFQLIITLKWGSIRFVSGLCSIRIHFTLSLNIWTGTKNPKVDPFQTPIFHIALRLRRSSALDDKSWTFQRVMCCAFILLLKEMNLANSGCYCSSRQGRRGKLDRIIQGLILRFSPIPSLGDIRGW